MTCGLPQVNLYPIMHEYEFVLSSLKHALIHKAKVVFDVEKITFYEKPFTLKVF